VAEVVRDLDGMSRRTGLSHGERRMLYTIGHVVVDIFKHIFLPSREGVPAPEPLL